LKRVDKILVELGLFESRKKAQVAVEKGLVSLRRKDKTLLIEKTSQELEVLPDDEWQIVADLEFEYVSRSGAKLHEALAHWKISVQGKNILDLGQSTGGFTDCVLRHGANCVVGFDVGREQLHPRLREDARILCLEKINARYPAPTETREAIQSAGITEPFDMIVCDVSFISVLPVISAQWELLKNGGSALLLFKPQFEVGRGVHDKKGTVPDEEGLRVLEKTVKTLSEEEKKVLGTFKTGLRGEDGNQEYFIYLQKG
jgi:23S rRNA (cytidine1920-2'-O)/16S rRNA (cytidine1409-2'-O)-methyltransferase